MKCLKFILWVTWILLTAWRLASWVAARAESEQVPQLTVIVLYDGNHDGQEEGVGQGVLVKIRESGSAIEFANYTDGNSSATYLVETRTYIVRAFPPQTRLFWTWVCEGSKQVDEPQEFLVLHCFERFFIRFPWAQGE